MNPYERINELRDYLEDIFQKEVEESDSSTVKRLYSLVETGLSLLEKDLSDVEYHFQVKSLKDKIQVFDNQAFSIAELNEDILIFQPMDTDISAIDLESMSETLSTLVEAGAVNGNILLIPPNVGVLKAKIAKE